MDVYFYVYVLKLIDEGHCAACNLSDVCAVCLVATACIQL